LTSLPYPDIKLPSHKGDNMNAFEAIARLNESSCMAIRGTKDRKHKYYHSQTETHTKAEIAKYGLEIPPAYLEDCVGWEIARICENCSGNGTVFNPDAIEGEPMHIECPECEGDKMIWGQE